MLRKWCIHTHRFLFFFFFLINFWITPIFPGLAHFRLISTYGIRNRNLLLYQWGLIAFSYLLLRCWATNLSVPGFFPPWVARIKTIIFHLFSIMDVKSKVLGSRTHSWKLNSQPVDTPATTKEVIHLQRLIYYWNHFFRRGY